MTVDRWNEGQKEGADTLDSGEVGGLRLAEIAFAIKSGEVVWERRYVASRAMLGKIEVSAAQQYVVDIVPALLQPNFGTAHPGASEVMCKCHKNIEHTYCHGQACLQEFSRFPDAFLALYRDRNVSVSNRSS
jgi:hypothetical protein